MPSPLHPSPSPSPDAEAGPQPRPDRPLAGIALVVASGLLFSFADAASKRLGETLPAIEIAWLRWGVFVAAMLPILLGSGGRVLRSAAPGLQVVRSLFLVGSSVLFIAGVTVLPLASATTISFVSPLLVAALSIPFLGETVGPRRWAAVLVGLVGVLIVIRPGSGTFGAAALLPLGSAACWAGALIVTRKLAALDGPWTAMSYAALVGFALLSLMVWPSFVRPSGPDLLLALGLGLFATIGQYLVVRGYRLAPASVLAPFSYMQLLWSTTLGFLVFGTLPDGWTGVGAAVIVGSGLYVAHRERIRARSASSAKP